jgi:hypothetical protein
VFTLRVAYLGRKLRGVRFTDDMFESFERSIEAEGFGPGEFIPFDKSHPIDTSSVDAYLRGCEASAAAFDEAYPSCSAPHVSLLRNSLSRVASCSDAASASLVYHLLKKTGVPLSPDNISSLLFIFCRDPSPASAPYVLELARAHALRFPPSEKHSSLLVRFFAGSGDLAEALGTLAALEAELGAPARLRAHLPVLELLAGEPAKDEGRVKEALRFFDKMLGAGSVEM